MIRGRWPIGQQCWKPLMQTYLRSMHKHFPTAAIFPPRERGSSVSCSLLPFFFLPCNFYRDSRRLDSADFECGD